MFVMPLATARKRKSVFSRQKKAPEWRAFLTPSPLDLADPLDGISWCGPEETLGALWGRVLDQAKQVTHADKAIMCPLAEGAPSAERAIVRGAVDVLPQAWWSALLARVPVESFEDRSPRVLIDDALTATMLCIPVSLADEPVGILAVAVAGEWSFTRDDVAVLTLLGHVMAGMKEASELRDRSEHALLANERDRIACEMHDGLAQSLFSASVGLEVCKRRAADSPEVCERLEDTQQLLSESLSELRRYIYDLRSARLESLGLVGAIRAKAGQADAIGRPAVALTVLGVPRDLAPSDEACIYRVVQESLSNATRHANASTVDVTLMFALDHVELTVADDGVGFDVSSAMDRSIQGGSMGLQSMRERVDRGGGTLRVESATGFGTTVHLELPA